MWVSIGSMSNDESYKCNHTTMLAYTHTYANTQTIICDVTHCHFAIGFNAIYSKLIFRQVIPNCGND